VDFLTEFNLQVPVIGKLMCYNDKREPLRGTYRGPVGHGIA